MPKDDRTPFAELPAAQQAGILCNDPRFQSFAATRCGLRPDAFNSSAAAEYIRTVCDVTSRKDLSHNPAARDRFEVIKTEFDAWTGRIPPQR